MWHAAKTIPQVTNEMVEVLLIYFAGACRQFASKTILPFGVGDCLQARSPAIERTVALPSALRVTSTRCLARVRQSISTKLPGPMFAKFGKALATEAASRRRLPPGAGAQERDFPVQVAAAARNRSASRLCKPPWFWSFQFE